MRPLRITIVNLAGTTLSGPIARVLSVRRCISAAGLHQSACRTHNATVLRIYLDQRDLIDCATAPGSPNARRLRELVEGGDAQVVLSFSHILETWKYAKASGRESVAALADSLRPAFLLYRPHLFRAELCAAFLRFLGHTVVTDWSPSTARGYFADFHDDERVHVFTPFRRSSFESHFPNETIDHATNETFLAYLRVLETAESTPEQLRSIHHAYATQSGTWKENLSSPGDVADLIAYHFDQGWFGPPVPQVVREAFLQQLAPTACPGLFVYAQLRTAILRDTRSHSAPSEMVDVAHAVALPYCDAFSADKRVADYLRRAGVRSEAFLPNSVGRMIPFKKLEELLNWIEGEVRVAGRPC